MRKSVMYAVPIALVTLMSVGSTAAQANDGVLFPNVHAMRMAQPTGGNFNQELVKEYKEIALFEADEMYDWFDAENHATKGVMAQGGKTPMPYDPENWGIENGAKMAELKSARTELVGLLDAGGREMAPSEAAIAQAKYDCWVEQQEEGHQPTHIAACRDTFLAALQNLKSAMEPKVATTDVTQTYAEVAREIVYFDFDKDNINPDAQAKIDAFVMEMRKLKGITLFITGHTDTSGSNAYNKDLSARRAANVRAELDRQGMATGDIDDLEIAADGEENLAVQTGDGVREQLNRRVEIIAQGAVTETSRVTTVTTN
ncbi:MULTISPECIES: OmpA family protein [Thalassobaculum]|uniref:OmpA-OmpF porin, OOP family n=1 Tax=Thalassobaculum litoreum DSM 18839 TaxID=1123362 RepID=A0A8G2EUY5_9PROT|nr:MULTISPECIES: OmpA family protein [Thalassobaculum]SDF62784.1 OmpA-OmpF porin, OOP family [Thalassobaculum litoreum DSM 18839]